jgi:hypothetical protein
MITLSWFLSGIYSILGHSPNSNAWGVTHLMTLAPLPSVQPLILNLQLLGCQSPHGNHAVANGAV